MDYFSYYLKHYYYWLYCICMPSDNEFFACVDRENSYGTPLLHTILYNKAYNLVLIVVVVVVVVVAAAVVV